MCPSLCLAHPLHPFSRMPRCTCQTFRSSHGQKLRFQHSKMKRGSCCPTLVPETGEKLDEKWVGCGPISAQTSIQLQFSGRLPDRRYHVLGDVNRGGRIILDCIFASTNTAFQWLSLVPSGMQPLSFVFVEPLVAQHYSHWQFHSFMELSKWLNIICLDMDIPTFVCTVRFNSWYVDFI